MKKILLFLCLALAVLAGCVQPGNPPATDINEPAASGLSQQPMPNLKPLLSSLLDKNNLIVATPDEFAITESEIEPGFILHTDSALDQLQKRGKDGIGYDAYISPTDYNGLDYAFDKNYALFQSIGVYFWSDSNYADLMLAAISDFLAPTGKVIDQNFMGDQSILEINNKKSDFVQSHPNLKVINLQFRVKNVVVGLNMIIQNLDENLAIEKLRKYAALSFNKIAESEAGKVLSEQEKDSIFGTCENDKNCGQELMCNESSLCSMTGDGTVACGPPEGDYKCYRPCQTNSDCQELCGKIIDCTKYVTKCTGTIAYWQGDAQWPMPVCMAFKKA